MPGTRLPSDLVRHFIRERDRHLSSYILHSIYWSSLDGRGEEPKPALAAAIAISFGSLTGLQVQLCAAADGLEDSGWAVLGFDVLNDKLVVLQCRSHQDLIAAAMVPLLVLDLFEHAYYLQYLNRRREYVDALFSIINWAGVAERFDAAHLQEQHHAMDHS